MDDGPNRFGRLYAKAEVPGPLGHHHQATNNEIKQAAVETLPYPIEHTAEQARRDDNGLHSSRSRQVFGMSWLMRNCEPQDDSNVPRNRVYARYAEACTQFRLQPLTHASFGKLVHIAFPRIRTRRLGVRGHSKYHYCGISLRSEREVSVFSPDPDPGPEPLTIPMISPRRIERGELILPSLREFVATLENDTWMTLEELYQTHCRACHEFLMVMDVQKLLNLIDTFALSMPLQRLLRNPVTVRWIEACDWIVYVEAVHNLEHMAMVQLPASLIDNLHLLLQEFPRQLQAHVRVLTEGYAEARTKAAKRFLHLVDRFLRVNEATIGAHTVLRTTAGEMGRDWRLAVTAIPALEAPRADCEPLISRHIRLDIPELLEGTSDAPLEKWVRYLGRLPREVPSCSRKMLNLSVSAVATACLRDLNRARCPTFGSWWVLRCWVDEYLLWVHEVGEYR